MREEDLEVVGSWLQRLAEPGLLVMCRRGQRRRGRGLRRVVETLLGGGCGRFG
jgi:hypothetical protein